MSNQGVGGGLERRRRECKAEYRPRIGAIDVWEWLFEHCGRIASYAEEEIKRERGCGEREVVWQL